MLREVPTVSAAERSGNNLKGSEFLIRKPMLESDLDCLACAICSTVVTQIDYQTVNPSRVEGERCRGFALNPKYFSYSHVDVLGILFLFSC